MGGLRSAGAVGVLRLAWREDGRGGCCPTGSPLFPPGSLSRGGQGNARGQEEEGDDWKAMQAAGTGPGTWGARIFLEAQRREPRFTRRKMGERGQQELEELGRDAARPWVGKKRGLA